ncbi:hypothetical protein ANCCAN_15721 [Ancylostoma caninum]|uniref:Uncharacterized protein n=1 Tax=Ancylostoma caninum TaxID=29170 RepID=A0A368G1X1_ANCCA|nr:hypothetical protein ANCCAN_15721 [Ancylostoma caninum]
MRTTRSMRRRIGPGIESKLHWTRKDTPMIVPCTRQNCFVFSCRSEESMEGTTRSLAMPERQEKKDHQQKDPESVQNRDLPEDAVKRKMFINNALFQDDVIVL